MDFSSEFLRTIGRCHGARLSVWHDVHEALSERIASLEQEARSAGEHAMRRARYVRDTRATPIPPPEVRSFALQRLLGVAVFAAGGLFFYFCLGLGRRRVEPDSLPLASWKASRD
jgi:hypothetical protein